MKRKILIPVLISLLASCLKGPTEQQLEGNWIQITDLADKSKLIVPGNNLMYYFHSATIDTFSYTLDTKHSQIFLNYLNQPSKGTISCEINYHKRKKILTIQGLFYLGNGSPGVTYFQPN